MWLFAVDKAPIAMLEKRQRRAFRRLSSRVVAQCRARGGTRIRLAGRTRCSLGGLVCNTLPHPGRRKLRVFASFFIAVLLFLWAVLWSCVRDRISFRP